jgi:hypothetical protein
MTKSGLAIGRVATLVGTILFWAREPAIARAGRMVANLHTIIPRAVARL